MKSTHLRFLCKGEPRMSLVKNSTLALATGLIFAIAGNSFAGTPKAADTKKADTKGDAKTEKPPHHAVPAHYAKIVNKEQQEKIYKIQDTYSPELKKLQEEI